MDVPCGLAGCTVDRTGRLRSRRGSVTVMVRECASSHSPHHGTVADVGRVTRRDRSAAGRAPAPDHAPRSGFWTRCSVRSTAGHPCARADSTAGTRLSGLAGASASTLRSLPPRSQRRHRSLRMGIQLVDSSGPAVGPPGGAALTPSLSRLGTGRVSNRDPGVSDRDGGSRIGTRRKVWCKGVIQIVAGRASRAGVVELWTPADEATRFQIPKCAQDCAPAGIGFGHQGANRGVAREVLVRLIRQEDEDELRRRGTDICVRRPGERTPAHPDAGDEDCASRSVSAESSLCALCMHRSISSTIKGVITLRHNRSQNYLPNFRVVGCLVTAIDRNAVKYRERRRGSAVADSVTRSRTRKNH